MYFVYINTKQVWTSLKNKVVFILENMENHSQTFVQTL